MVCYIYFTRIIVYLLENTLPFHFIWLAAAASEAATIIFYVAAGWSFRRAARRRRGQRAGAPALQRCVPARPPAPAAPQNWRPPCCLLSPPVCRPMPAGANPYFQLTEEEAIELTKVGGWVHLHLQLQTGALGGSRRAAFLFWAAGRHGARGRADGEARRLTRWHPFRRCPHPGWRAGGCGGEPVIAASQQHPAMNP